jgi:hypothetical protein
MFAFDEYRKLLIELQNEFKTGWLKPCQLKKLIGVPAADLLRKEIEEEKVNSKKLDKLNKSDTAITKTNIKASSNLPSIEKTRTVFIHNDITDTARSNSARRNVKKSSWKDYFTDAELTELNKPTALESIIESKDLLNRNSGKQLVKREDSLRAAMILANEKCTELVCNKLKNDEVVQEHNQCNAEIDEVVLVDEKKSYVKRVFKRPEPTSYRNELRGIISRGRPIDHPSKLLNSRNSKKAVSAVKSKETVYKTEESSCERTLQAPWLTVSVDNKLNIRGIGEQRVSSGLFSYCKQYPIANNVSQLKMTIDQRKNIVDKKDKRNAHSNVKSKYRSI